MNNKPKFGFSLIELSIVILIIGILVIGISKGSRIISEAKLKSARQLTAGSPVNSTSDIVLWVDASSDKSIDSTVASGSVMTSWNDLNPQTPNKNNATASGSPIYTTNVLNGLPVVKFNNTDASNDFFTFDGKPMARKDYTIFIVSARRSSQDSNIIIGGDDPNNFLNLHIGYFVAGTKFRIGHYGDGATNVDFLDYTSTFTVPTFELHTINFGQNNSRNYYLNSGLKIGPLETSIARTPITNWTGAAIGRMNTSIGLRYFYGDIGEIIIFNRYLTALERQSIEKYLGQKWGIKLV